MTRGQKVVDTALRYLGVRETSSNAGPYIDQWQRRWGMGRGTRIGPQPWCGMFLNAMFAEAGVSDDNISHPSTAEICRRGEAKGARWNGTSPIPPGAIWVNCGIHAALVRRQINSSYVETIDGNSSDMVRLNTRPVRGNNIRIYIPSEVRRSAPPPPPPAPKYEYFLVDKRGKRHLFAVNGKVARWKKQAAVLKRVNQLRKNPEYRELLPRPHKSGGWFYIILGPLASYGPFKKIDSLKNARKILEKRLGYRLQVMKRKVN